MTLLTLTLSPALDVEYRSEKTQPSGMLRTREHRMTAGGKGINVSRSILKCAARFGECVNLKTVAPVGGETGQTLKRLLEKEGIQLTGVEIEENTRVNVSLIPDEGESLEINAPGTPVGDRLAEIENAVLDGLEEDDVVVIAGSCPKDVPKSYPASLVAKIRKKGAFAVLDCDGEALKIAVNAPEDERPNLIKPNERELCELAGIDPSTADEKALRAAAEGLGIDTVITTRAEKEAMLTCRVWNNGKTVFFEVKEEKVVRLKGAGDTFLGAFVYTYCVRKEPPEWAMETAQDAAGSWVRGE